MLAVHTAHWFNLTSIRKLNKIQQIKNIINLSFLALLRQKQTGNKTFSWIFDRLCSCYIIHCCIILTETNLLVGIKENNVILTNPFVLLVLRFTYYPVPIIKPLDVKKIFFFFLQAYFLQISSKAHLSK